MLELLMTASPIVKAKAVMASNKAQMPNADALETVTDAILETKDKLQCLYPVEKEAQYALTKRLAELEAKKADLEELGNLQPPLSYPRMSTEALSWRTYKKLPSLVPFMLDHPVYHWDIDRGYVHETPKLPKGMMHSHYQDVRDMLIERSQENRWHYASRVEVTGVFTGLIPDEAREKINAAIPVFGKENIILLTETHLNYKEKSYAPPDPIACAYRAGQLWYICDFDLSPVEEAALLVKV